MRAISGIRLPVKKKKKRNAATCRVIECTVSPLLFYCSVSASIRLSGGTKHPTSYVLTFSLLTTGRRDYYGLDIRDDEVRGGGVRSHLGGKLKQTSASRFLRRLWHNRPFKSESMNTFVAYLLYAAHCQEM